MIEDFYNRDFTDPTLDSRTEMSQDEGKFMQITDGQLSLRTGTIKSLYPLKIAKRLYPTTSLRPGSAPFG